jgi:hypothetical protein
VTGPNKKLVDVVRSIEKQQDRFAAQVGELKGEMIVD